MTDLICRKTMQRCQYPGMCSPHGGCQPDKGFEVGYLDLGQFVDWVWNLKAERDQLKAENEALRKDAELLALGRAKLAGAMSRLRAKHNDWTAPEALPAAELVWCACGDGFPPNSYGAGFMDANNGICWSCDAAKAVSHD